MGKLVLLHCLVQPVFVSLSESGRPLGTHTVEQPWTIPYERLGEIRSLVEQIEAAHNEGRGRVPETGRSEAEERLLDRKEG